MVEVVSLGLHLRLELQLADLAGRLQEGRRRHRSDQRRPRRDARVPRRPAGCLLARSRHLIGIALCWAQGDPLCLQHGVQRELAVLVHHMTVQVLGVLEFLRGNKNTP